MSDPAVIVTPYALKVARKGKWCSICRERIPSGARYALLSMWAWAHPKCAERAVS